MTRKATERAVSRRGFIKGSTLATLATAAGAGTAASLFGCAPQSAQSKGELAQTRFPRREKSSGRAAATAALLHAPSSATS